MGIIYNLEERKVIPNWRDFKRTVQLYELRGIGDRNTKLKFDLSKIKEDWNKNNSIGIGAELINAAFISNQLTSNELSDAIKLFKNNPDQSTKSINDLIDLIKNKNGTKTERSILELDVNTLEQFQSFIDNNTLHKLISRTKTLSHKQLRNPIIWVELSRLYAMKGQDNKAEKSMLTALHLAPNNRFVLRSATRFFIHNSNPEKALYYLRKSSVIKSDPWLIAAHIATSNVIGRFSPFIKQGISMVNSDNYDPYDLTELASSIGSQEYYEGTFKKAKYFLNKSLIAPNDNSLAQLEWLSQDDDRLNINIFNFENVINPFEAYAFDFYSKGAWEKAFENTIKWFLDTPFSKRPILMSSFIVSNMLNDNNTALLLTKIGLQANPNDPALLNNILYYIAKSGELGDIDKYVNRIKELDQNKLTDSQKVILKATLGLIAIKRGFLEEGINLYEIAIKDAQRINDDYLEQLAILNLTRELIQQNHQKKRQYIERVKKLSIDRKHLDLIFINNALLELIERDLN